jgi:hypothetical protein
MLLAAFIKKIMGPFKAIGSSCKIIILGPFKAIGSNC